MGASSMAMFGRQMGGGFFTFWMISRTKEDGKYVVEAVIWWAGEALHFLPPHFYHQCGLSLSGQNFCIWLLGKMGFIVSALFLTAR